MIDLSAVSELVDQLVIANQILYKQGVVDGLGHVSVRNPSTSPLIAIGFR